MAKASKRTTKRKKGRPTRREASKKALRGVDLATIDPRQVLLEIAGDRSAPATARLQAARALLNGTAEPQRPRLPEDQETNPVARRALRILNGGRA
ncbi:hypothetical protein RX327_20005 [Bradyrhizobium sp. BEA-2-5]|uniref:hypothetical protein n=1 Tax=Bradyrhizobium sp. BEA-2-5 TaxID=3080015 RepID=UPI00293F6D86|nr:hypothetical protein [Bradyrhizobium sp. BEA-2-5]WOH78254.1 hypothetical protein RX327_20005 [Bradyrhizobium sp. BEA-2-5]